MPHQQQQHSPGSRPGRACGDGSAAGFVFFETVGTIPGSEWLHLPLLESSGWVLFALWRKPGLVVLARFRRSCSFLRFPRYSPSRFPTSASRRRDVNWADCGRALLAEAAGGQRRPPWPLCRRGRGRQQLQPLYLDAGRQPAPGRESLPFWEPASSTARTAGNESTVVQGICCGNAETPRAATTLLPCTSPEKPMSAILLAGKAHM